MAQEISVEEIICKLSVEELQSRIARHQDYIKRFDAILSVQNISSESRRKTLEAKQLAISSIVDLELVIERKTA